MFDENFNPIFGMTVLAYPMDGNRIMTYTEMGEVALAALRDGEAVAAMTVDGEMIILRPDEVPPSAHYPGTYEQIEAQIMRQAQQWDALWN